MQVYTSIAVYTTIRDTRVVPPALKNFKDFLKISTGIPRLTRFSIARFPIARIFEVVQENLHSTVLYLKIYSVMQIFLTFFQVIL